MNAMLILLAVAVALILGAETLPFSLSGVGCTLKEKGKVSGQLSSALGTLWAVAENYPNLKANENFIELQKSLAEIEDQIQLSRRYYNGAVRNLNIAIQSFPGNVIAGLFKFTPADYFQTESDQDRELPKVKWS